MTKATITRRRSAEDDADIVNRVFAALVVAKDACALLPPLPPKIKPIHISVLNAMHKLRDGDYTRVSDINSALGFALPNTTRLVNELVSLDVVRKAALEEDKRVVLVQLTRLGERYTRDFVLEFHNRLHLEFSRLPPSDCEKMITMIHRVYQLMQKATRVRRHKEST